MSKNTGRNQIKFLVLCTDEDGKKAKVFDYMFFHEAAFFKLVGFCKAAGLEQALKEKKLEDFQCLGKKGKCIGFHEEYKGEMSNKIKKYIIQKEDSPLAKNHKTEVKDLPPEFNSDIPF